MTQPPDPISRPAFELRRGPWPGLLGDVVAMHGRYYAANWQFPVVFEAKVAAEMGGFLTRYDAASDLVLSVVGAEPRATASITLDVSDPALPRGIGHIRWFVVEDHWRGKGVGRRLLEDVLTHARAGGLGSLYLTTFRGLDAAAALYRQAGFVVTDEREGQTWGRTVVEQRLELSLQG